MGKSCAFFGHRFILCEQQVIPLLREAIINLITHEGVDTFYTGEHGRFDILAYQTVLDIQKEYPHIRVVFVASYVRQLHRDRFVCDAFDYPVPVTVPPRFAIGHRNKYVADNSDYLICWIDVKHGGAYQAMRRAVNRQKAVINLTSIRG